VRGKRDIERELIHAEAKIESLQTLLESAQTDREELKSQVTKLQDALVAARAPEAYRDQQIAKEEENRTPRDQAQIDKNRLMQETTEGYMRALERPLAPEDLDAFLARGLMHDIDGPLSLHGNDES
jgi:peptidoglycan hydrolase CwlO-like protein